MKRVSWIFVAVAPLLLACYTRPDSPVVQNRAPEASDPGTTVEIVDSERIADLDTAGVVLGATLAETMTKAKAADKKAGDTKRVHAIMESFTESLGVKCSYCHAPKVDADGNPVNGTNGKPSLDFEVETPEKRVAERMWNEWVVNFRFADSDSPVFCDSCHQGTAQFLDRAEPRKLDVWMKENFTAKLVDPDGNAVKCANCHGKPFDKEFLESWKQGD
jgi:hypothetical protein